MKKSLKSLMKKSLKSLINPVFAEKDFSKVNKIEIGCGSAKREGFFGIDIAKCDAVDLVLDVEKEALPFKNDSIEYIYSSHAFEHFSNYRHVFSELLRVCKHDAIIEIWTPYGKSNDGFLFGHSNFFTEAHFKHVCFEYDRFFLGESKGYFNWEKTHYNLFPGIIEELSNMNICLEFAIEHLFNIAMEWGVFLRVDKTLECAPGPQYPNKIYSYAGRHPLLEIN